MPGSKPGALPLGDTPILLNVYPSPKSHVYRQLIELNNTEAHFTTVGSDRTVERARIVRIRSLPVKPVIATSD